MKTSEETFVNEVIKKGIFLEEYGEIASDTFLNTYVEKMITHEDSFTSEQKGIALGLSYFNGSLEEGTFEFMYEALKNKGYKTSTSSFIFGQSENRRYIVIVPNRHFADIHIIGDNKKAFYVICGFVYGSTFEVVQESYLQ